VKSSKEKLQVLSLTHLASKTNNHFIDLAQSSRFPKSSLSPQHHDIVESFEMFVDFENLIAVVDERLHRDRDMTTAGRFSRGVFDINGPANDRAGRIENPFDKFVPLPTDHFEHECPREIVRGFEQILGLVVVHDGLNESKQRKKAWFVF
jgi:hypothetical protein